MKYQVMPPLSAEEYKELKADIKARGVLVPVEYDEVGEILDGYHRIRICEELGIKEYPKVVRLGLSETGKLTHARKLNLARRHLDREQKRVLISQQLKETPQLGDRQVARDLGCDHKTVAAVRTDLEKSGEIPHFSERLDPRTGKASQPAERPKAYRYTDPTPEGQVAILQSAKDIRLVKADAKRKENASLEVPPPPEGKYRCIVIDPPWQTEKIARDVAPNQVAFEYPTMTEEQLSNFKVQDFSDDDCHLFCWTTHKHLPVALRLLDVWGFKYVCTMVWHKPGGFQPFGLPQYNCEFALYARRGSPKFKETKDFMCCFNAPRREHSRKPDEFYDVIRRVTGAPRIDVFSREKRKGFEQHGNQKGKFGDVA